jgi:hypothetical protein
MSTLHTSRRATLGVSVAALLGSKTALAAPLNPDADLIRIAAEHVVNLRTFNASMEPGENGPLWQKYRRTYVALDEAQPQTLAGVAALARAAAAEHAVDGGDNVEWAFSVVDGLVRVMGDVA